jgi:hypothetical protein
VIFAANAPDLENNKSHQNKTEMASNQDKTKIR